MRVTHIITRLVVGGAQENTLSTIGGLCQYDNLQVKLISGPTTGPEGSLEAEARKIPDLLTVLPELVRPVRPYEDVVALKKLENILRQQEPDIVHTHSGKAGILGRLAAHQAGVPIIIHHIHGPSFGPFQGWLANKIFTGAERYAARVTDHFFCSAAAMTKLYLSAGIGVPEMYTRIFSGFTLTPFIESTNDLALRAKLGLSPRHFVIGKVGRLFRLKGHAEMVMAFARIHADVPHARLLLVGDGILRREIEHLVKELRLTDKVIFTGLVAPAEVPRYLGIMDCLAHLSSREALSRALPQALAAGKPVVAYDFDGADEVCQENVTGFLVKTGDYATAARRIVQLASNPELCRQFGETGRAFVRQNFTIEKMVTDQYAQYMRLAAEYGIEA